MFSLQKPMPRGRYALVALAHVLLLGGLLWGMVRAELSYMPPLSALACLAGMGVLASLVAATIRRMRDAGIRGIFLLAPWVWCIGLVYVCVALFWVAMATPASGSLAIPYTDAQSWAFIIVGIIFVPLTVASLCTPTQKKRREPRTLPAGFLCNYADALANTFRFSGRATLREFWLFAIPATIVAGAPTIFMMNLIWMNDVFRFLDHIFGDPAAAVFLSILSALFLPLLSITFRRARDAGHFRRWLAALFFLVLGAVLYVWVIVPAAYFPHESPLATFYVFSAYPLYVPAFLLYSLYVFIKPGEK